jgi:hypothetical protein
VEEKAGNKLNKKVIRYDTAHLQIANKSYCDGRERLQLLEKYRNEAGQFVKLKKTDNDPLRSFPRCMYVPLSDELSRMIEDVGTDITKANESRITALEREVSALKELLKNASVPPLMYLR